MGDRVGGKTVGWLAGLGTAVAPTLIFVSSMLYPTALYTLIVTGLTLTALILADEPRAGPAIGFGVLAALGLLTDTVIAAPLSVLVIWLLLRVRAVGPALLRVLGIALVTVLVLLLPYQLLRRQQGGSSLAFIQKSQWVLHFARTDSTLDADRWVKLPAQQTTIILPVRDFLRQEWTLLATSEDDQRRHLFLTVQAVSDRVLNERILASAGRAARTAPALRCEAHRKRPIAGGVKR